MNNDTVQLTKIASPNDKLSPNAATEAASVSANRIF